MKNIAFILLCLFLLPQKAGAESPSLSLPADCRLNENCWINNYVDNDSSAEARDFTCGPQTYNDHFGTDIGIADLVTMETGVDILAAADGTVMRVRDGVEDKTVTPEERTELLKSNKGCGNGVFVDHGDGWQTIYCHMKKGSIAVKPDQKVKRGDKLGQIGNSGIAEFPHVHLGVFFEGNPVDPFIGMNNSGTCGANENPLWRDDITYQPVAIYASGFKAGVPDFEAFKIDTASPKEASTNAPALTFWTGFYGVRKDDKITIEITDPAGRIWASRNITMDKDRARQFYFVGKKVSRPPLESGTYTGHVTLIRDNADGTTYKAEDRKTIIIR